MTSSIKPHVQKHHHAAIEEPSHGHRYRALIIGEVRTFSSEDMIADRKTHTDTHIHRQTDRQTLSSQDSAPLSGTE